MFELLSGTSSLTLVHSMIKVDKRLRLYGRVGNKVNGICMKLYHQLDDDLAYGLMFAKYVFNQDFSGDHDPMHLEVVFKFA